MSCHGNKQIYKTWNYSRFIAVYSFALTVTWNNLTFVKNCTVEQLFYSYLKYMFNCFQAHQHWRQLRRSQNIKINVKYSIVLEIRVIFNTLRRFKRNGKYVGKYFNIYIYDILNRDQEDTRLAEFRSKKVPYRNMIFKYFWA